MKNYRYLLLSLVCLMALPIFAQKQRSQEFKDKYKIKEAVVLSRHNIRAPLSDNNSLVGKMTPHKWHKWSAAKSELTSRGGTLETQMGQYFRKWADDAGLFPENYVPTKDDANFYANSMQRTIATGRYFASGFMPVGDVVVNHRYAASKMDPLFNPVLTKVNKKFKEQATKEIAAMGGKNGVRGINEKIAPDYAYMLDVLDVNDSPIAKANDPRMKYFTNYDSEVILEPYQEPHFADGVALKELNLAADAFVLQYYEEPDTLKATFGHKVSRKDFEKIARVKDTYQNTLFTSPIVAVNVAHPLIQYMYDELRSPDRKFTLLVGHDSNLSAVLTALGIAPYECPQALEKNTPIGAKIVIEKFEGADGQEYGDINLVYQSVDQLRNMELLDLDNPPMILNLQLDGVQPNADGLYPMQAIYDRFESALRAYDAI